MAQAGVRAADIVTPTDAEQARVTSKVFRRLIGFLFLAYCFSYLDRINIGFAALSMNKDLALTATAFGFASTLFYLGYMVCEIPSNLMLARFGARAWIARIMVTWGIASTATMFAVGPMSLYVARSVLGIAEAGFVPGVILYLSLWFPAACRARAMAVLLMAQPATFLVGSPLSGYILQLHGYLGIAGWRWLFLIEGLPSILLGIWTYFYLDDGPKDAKWLTETEQSTLQKTLDNEGGTAPVARTAGMWQEIRSARVLLLAFGYFCLVTSLNTYATWNPQIIREFIHGVNAYGYIGLLGAIPALFTLVAMPLVGLSSDRSQERLVHTSALFAVTAVGWLAVTVFAMPPLRLGGLVLVSVGAFAAMAMFWTLATPFLSVRNRPGSIAFINTVGIFASAVSPTIVGVLRDLTHSFDSAIWYTVALLVLGIVALNFAVMGPKAGLPGAAADGNVPA